MILDRSSTILDRMSSIAPRTESRCCAETSATWRATNAQPTWPWPGCWCNFGMALLKKRKILSRGVAIVCGGSFGGRQGTVAIGQTERPLDPLGQLPAANFISALNSSICS